MPDSFHSKEAKKWAITIKSWREKNFPAHGGMTTAAKKIGVTTAVWSSWESGKVAPSEINQRKLATLFGVTLDVLRGDHSPAPAPPPEPEPLDPMAEALKALTVRAERAEARADALQAERDTLLVRAVQAETRLEELQKNSRGLSAGSSKRSNGAGAG